MEAKEGQGGFYA